MAAWSGERAPNSCPVSAWKRRTSELVSPHRAHVRDSTAKHTRVRKNREGSADVRCEVSLAGLMAVIRDRAAVAAVAAADRVCVPGCVDSGAVVIAPASHSMGDKSEGIDKDDDAGIEKHEEEAEEEEEEEDDEAAVDNDDDDDGAPKDASEDGRKYDSSSQSRTRSGV